MIDIDADTACRNMVDIIAPRTTYVVSLMATCDKQTKYLFWLQAIGLMETWFMIYPPEKISQEAV